MTSDVLQSYINSFVESTCKIFKQVLFIEMSVESKEDGAASIQVTSGIKTTSDYLVQVPYSGEISGDYFICFDHNDWESIVKDALESTDKEMQVSAAKEILNNIVGEAITPMRHDFPGLTYATPRVIQGTIDYPGVKALKANMISEHGDKVDIIITIDHMKQEIEKMLEEEITQKIKEFRRAQSAERSINDIFANVPLGLFSLDEYGVIQPGVSFYSGNFLGVDAASLIDKKLVDAIPLEIMRYKENEVCSWIEALLNDDFRSESWELHKKKNPLQQVSFYRGDKEFSFGFSFHPLIEENSRRFLCIIEDLSEKKRLERQLIESTTRRASLESKMRMARTIGKSLLPSYNRLDCLSIFTEHLQTNYFGGNWYSVYTNENEDFINIYCGSTQDQGISAALLSSVTYGTVHSLEKHFERSYIYDSQSNQLTETARILESNIRSIDKKDQAMAMTFLSIDTENEIMSYINAGGMPIYLLKEQDSSLHTLANHTSYLGQKSNFFDIFKIKLSKGDMIFMFTPGLIKNTGPDDEQVRLKEIKKLLLDDCTTPQIMINKVRHHAQQVWGNKPIDHDTFMIAMRWKGKPE